MMFDYTSKTLLCAFVLLASSSTGARAETWIALEGRSFGAWEEMDQESLSLVSPGFIEFRLRGRYQDLSRSEVMYNETIRLDCVGMRRAVIESSLGRSATTELVDLILGTPRHASALAACRVASRLNDRLLPPQVPPRPTQPTVPTPPVRTRSTGSGFLVSPNVVVTNFHVVEGCTTLKVRHDSTVVGATLKASTERNDIAAIAVERPVGTPASVRNSALLGEDVVVAGHPLAGVLASDLIVTSGQVNSLAGLGNDPNMLQISAPVQPGNSGGPLIDRSGSIVGVVVSKLNVERLAKFTGDLAQNVNFAIKPEVLRLFLDANRIAYRTAAPGKRLEGFEIAERARSFTVQVLCD